ncbi:MAG: lantibiotic dehydratase family protein [Acidiferrobacterales bacterium]|nr:lantibiotic dehydratase family protein [Acidiferrobacterales bacterium]
MILSFTKWPISILGFWIIYSSSAHAFELSTVDQTLRESEASHTDIVTGAEKQIGWFAVPGVKTPISIVYLHGFSATHKELSPMTEQLANRLKANVFYSRLTGHGRSDDAMAEATPLAWQKDSKEAYEVGATIGERVLLIGTSTGGTLTTWLSAQPFTDKLLANVLISPNFALNGGGAWLMKNSAVLWLIKKINGEYRGFEPLNEFHAMYWTERYPIDALVPMLELLDEVDDLDKSKVRAPQMLIYSPNDQVIDVEKALDTAKEFSSAEVTVVPFTTSTDPSQHVLVGYGSTTGNEVQEQVDKMLDILVPYVKGLTTK